jgi:hypothetical protein
MSAQNMFEILYGNVKMNTDFMKFQDPVYATGMCTVLDLYDDTEITPASINIDVDNVDIKKFANLMKTANDRKNFHNASVDNILAKHIGDSGAGYSTIPTLDQHKEASIVLKNAIRKRTTKVSKNALTELTQ